MNENGVNKTSFRDTLMKGVSGPKTLASRLEDIDNEEICYGKGRHRCTAVMGSLTAIPCLQI